MDDVPRRSRGRADDGRRGGGPTVPGVRCTAAVVVGGRGGADGRVTGGAIGGRDGSVAALWPVCSTSPSTRGSGDGDGGAADARTPGPSPSSHAERGAAGGAPREA